MVEAALGLLDANEALRRRVRILSGIDDGELALLYRTCLFTLYPSRYEGWGLPVTESLCNGKVPLISAVSSLPEAGGRFAEYFAAGCERDLCAKLERLIDDRDYRATREAEIARSFAPRHWHDLAGEIVAGLRRVPLQQRVRWQPPDARTGVFHALSRQRRETLRPGLVGGEIYRDGDGWWAPESWGCWMKAPIAELVIPLDGAVRAPQRLFLGLRAVPGDATQCALSIGDGEPAARVALDADRHAWVALEIGAAPRPLRVRLASTAECDLTEASGGMDRRVVTLGVLGFYLCPAADRSCLLEAEKIGAEIVARTPAVALPP
jgi:hypothetical protein